jgi:hypothetical protein
MIIWLRNFLRLSKSDKIEKRLNLENGKLSEEPIEVINLEVQTIDLQEKYNCQKPIDNTKFIWCLIGNIINEHNYGTEKEVKHGTKHFSPNTKVYCFPTLWGDGYEKIKVIGRHRKTNKNVCIITPSKLIKNWRLQKVYRPYVLKVMHSQNGWTNSDNDKETILEMIKWLQERKMKID